MFATVVPGVFASPALPFSPREGSRVQDPLWSGRLSFRRTRGRRSFHRCRHRSRSNAGPPSQSCRYDRKSGSARVYRWRRCCIPFRCHPQQRFLIQVIAAKMLVGFRKDLIGFQKWCDGAVYRCHREAGVNRIAEVPGVAKVMTRRQGRSICGGECRGRASVNSSVVRPCLEYRPLLERFEGSRSSPAARPARTISNCAVCYFARRRRLRPGLASSRTAIGWCGTFVSPSSPSRRSFQASRHAGVLIGPFNVA